MSFSGGVRKNSHYTKTTDSEIEKLIIRWLNLAGDRDGGRKQRELAKRDQLNMADHTKGVQPPKSSPAAAVATATTTATPTSASASSSSPSMPTSQKLPDHLNKVQANRLATGHTDPRGEPEPGGQSEPERLRDQMDPSLNRPENSWTLFQSAAAGMMDPRNVRLNL